MTTRAERFGRDVKTRKWILKCLLESYTVTHIAKLLKTSPTTIHRVTEKYGRFERARHGRKRFLLWGWAQERSGLTDAEIYLSTAEKLPGAPGYPFCYGWIAAR